MLLREKMKMILAFSFTVFIPLDNKKLNGPAQSLEKFMLKNIFIFSIFNDKLPIQTFPDNFVEICRVVGYKIEIILKVTMLLGVRQHFHADIPALRQLIKSTENFVNFIQEYNRIGVSIPPELTDHKIPLPAWDKQICFVITRVK